MEKIINLDKKLFLAIYNNTENARHIFQCITNISKPFFVISYALLLVYIFLNKNFDTLLICTIIPFLTIIICKILRKIINRKRPYLVFPELNIQKKEVASFPSNHSASSFVISFMFLFVSFKLFLLFFLLALIVSVSRIIVGIHFPLDILSGFFIPAIIYLTF